MKKNYLLLLIACAIFSCTKQVELTDSSPQGDGLFLQRIKYALKDSIDSETFSSLDFSHCIKTPLPGNSNFVIRIRFLNLDNNEKSLFIKTDRNGHIISIRLMILQLQNGITSASNPMLLNGSLIITNSKKEILKQLLIQNGYSKRSKAIARVGADENDSDNYIWDSGGMLQEVIVVAYTPTNTHQSTIYSPYIGVNVFFPPDEELNNFYIPAFAGNSQSSGEKIDTRDKFEEVEGIEIDQRNTSKEIIDLAKKFECFNNVPSTGAKYYVQLNVDIPVNGKPNIAVDPTLSPGHAFITMTKQNGSIAASETFGFYPQSGLNAFISDKGVPSEIVNDGNSRAKETHEYNASVFMEVTESQFTAMQVAAQINSANKYELRGYNCAAYALSVFNTARPIDQWIKSNPLNNYWTGDLQYSPQGVYLFLQDLQKNYNYSGYIEVGVVKHATESSNCN